MELLDKDKKFLKEYKKFDNLGDVLIILLVFNFCALFFSGGMNAILVKFLLLALIFSPFLYLLIFFIGYHIIERSLCNKYQISKQDAENRQIFLSDDIKYVPLLQRFSKMNPDAKSSQFKLLKEWYGLDDTSISEYFFNREYSEDDWDYAVEQLKGKEFDTKKSFIHRLFQLSILEDGIHNDEWKLLMQLITDLRFNKNYINYFKERYESLRTEFDESEWKGSSSTTTYVLASPKEYYDVLGLSEGASYEEIKRAYHELALQHHPDLPKNADRTEECEKMMMKINEAYEKLRSKS